MLMGLLLVFFPEHLALLRILVATFIANAAVMVQLAVRPYRRHDDNALAAVAGLVLSVSYTPALVVYLYDAILELQPETLAWEDKVSDMMGIRSPYGFSVLLVVVSMIYISVSASVLTWQGRAAWTKEREKRQVKVDREVEIQSLMKKCKTLTDINRHLSERLSEMREESSLRTTMPRSMFTFKSPMEQVLSILRPLAATMSGEGEAAAMERAIKIIQEASFNQDYSVNVREELQRLESTSDQFDGMDADMLAFLTESEAEAAPRPEFAPDMSSHKISSGQIINRVKFRQTEALQGVTLDWDYDVIQLDEVTSGHALSAMFVHLLDRRALVRELDLDRQTLMTFVTALETRYGGNPYHSHIHGADVLLGMYLFIEPFLGLLSPAQQFAALFAAACHDFAHPGTTNAHEAKVNSERAIRHNDDSVLERYHLESTFTLLLQPRFNFLKHFTREQFAEFRKLVIQLVLLTDLSKHFDFIARIKSMEEGSLQERLEGALSRAGKGPDDVASDVKRQSGDIELLLLTAIKFCDLGHSFKPWALHEKWSLKVTQEFFLLGDYERKNNIPISPLCDREKDTNLPKSQKGFLEFLIYPLCKAVAQVFPMRKHALENLDANYDVWVARARPRTSQPEASRRSLPEVSCTSNQAEAAASPVATAAAPAVELKV